MKSIIVDVPRDGVRIELFPQTDLSSSQVIVVLTDEVEVRLAQPSPSPAAHSIAMPILTTENRKQLPAESKKSDLNYILKRLLKLKPSTKTAAVNSIKAMFQFEAPVSDQETNRILDNLCKQGHLKIDTSGKIQYRDTQPGSK